MTARSLTTALFASQALLLAGALPGLASAESARSQNPVRATPAPRTGAQETPPGQVQKPAAPKLTVPKLTVPKPASQTPALQTPAPPKKQDAGQQPVSVTTTPTTPVATAAMSTGVAQVNAQVNFGPYRLPPARTAEKRVLTFEFEHSRVQLTRTQLMALPYATLTTRHAQLNRTYTYQGVLLRTLATAMHSSGQDLRVYASNGFVATITAQDYLNAPIMLAYAANGEPISILEKGPLTIVLPSGDPRFTHKSAYWVWFVERITPVPQP